MKDNFSSDGALVIVAAFLICLITITWVEIISNTLNAPKIVEFSWIFVLLLSYSGASALFFAFRRMGRTFKVFAMASLLVFLFASIFFLKNYIK